MTVQNTFSIHRINLLFRQHLIVNGKLILISMVGAITGLFIVLYSIQRFTQFDTWTYKHFMMVFMPLYMVLAVLYAGSSFLGLRSRSNAMQYLTLPISSRERFFFELLLRIILFAILMPSFFWVIFHLEGKLVELIHPEFTFQSFSYLEGFRASSQFQNNLIMTFVAVHLLLFLTVPFFGATVFRKNPIIKTVAWAFGILFAGFLLFIQVIELITKQYMIEFTGVIIVFNISLMILAYFNLKRKQV